MQNGIASDLAVGYYARSAILLISRGRGPDPKRKIPLDSSLFLNHNDDNFITLMNTRKRKKLGDARLTISLGEEQRKELETIAQKNLSSLAFVIRHALNHFIVEHRDKQLRLNIPE